MSGRRSAAARAWLTIASLVGVVSATALAPSAHAQAGQGRAQGLRPVEAPRTISLAQAYTLAAQRSFDLRIASVSVDEARARVQQAWSSLLPRVTLGGGYTYSYPSSKFSLGDPAQLRQQALLFNTLAEQTAAQAAQISDPVQQRAAFERAEELRAAASEIERSKVTEIEIQPPHSIDAQLQVQLPIFNARSFPLLQNAYSGVELTRLGGKRARGDIVFGVARAYYQAAAARRIVAIAAKQVDSARGHRDVTAERVAAGLLTSLALQRAELELLRADQQQRGAAGALSLAKAALGSLIGAVEDFDIIEPPAAPSVDPGASGTTDDLVVRALHARDELRLQRESLAMAERNHTDAWLRLLPTLALVGTGRATSNTGGLVSNPFTGSLALQAQVPLFDGGLTLGVINESDAQRRVQLLRVRQAEEQIEREVRGAANDLALKRDAVATADRVAALALAQQENVDVLFAEGAVTNLEVTDAHLGAFSAEVEAARARFDLETARLGLTFAIGELRPVEDIDAAPLTDAEVSAARVRVEEPALR